MSEGLSQKFCDYWSQIEALQDFSVPRAYSEIANSFFREVYAFCDASTKAYATILYIKYINSVRKVTVNFLSAKTRVAPLNSYIIPRLELEAAMLLTDQVFECAAC